MLPAHKWPLTADSEQGAEPVQAPPPVQDGQDGATELPPDIPSPAVIDSSRSPIRVRPAPASTAPPSNPIRSRASAGHVLTIAVCESSAVHAAGPPGGRRTGQ